MRYAVVLRDFILSTAQVERDKLRERGIYCDLAADHMGEYILLFDNEGAAAKYESGPALVAENACPFCLQFTPDLVYSPDLSISVCQGCANFAYATKHGCVEPALCPGCGD